ncbi:MAG: sugar ABC transporter substrate-binding protein [Caldilineaceae bacterium]|nr:sugar ABC transporter substrate-binding protein [Caldilineaceae bacterium]
MPSSRLDRRSFLRLVGGVSAGMALAACVPAVAPQGGESGAPAAERAALVYWAPQHFIPEQNDFYTESLKLAAETNGFDVDVQLFPWGEYTQKQNAAIEAGTLPDALLGVNAPQHHAMGILTDVSDLFAEIDATGGGFYDPDKNEVTIGGVQWGIPFHNEPQFLYYRNDVLEAAGFSGPVETLDQFVEAAKATTDPANRMWGFGNAYTLVPDGSNFMQMLIFAFGGKLQDEEGNIVINSPETAAALQWSSDLLNVHKVMPEGVTGWDDTGNNKAFLSGQLAMVYNSGSVLNNMRESDPGWLQSTVIGPMPAGPTGAPTTFNGGSMAGIMASSKYPDQARLLIKGTLSPERYPGNLEAASGMFYSVLKDYETLSIFQDDPWNKQAAAMVPYAYLAHEPGDPAPWINEVGGAFLYAEMAARVAVEGWTPEDAIADFEKKANEIKAKYEQA